MTQKPPNPFRLERPRGVPYVLVDSSHPSIPFQPVFPRLPKMLSIAQIQDHALRPQWLRSFRLAPPPQACIRCGPREYLPQPEPSNPDAAHSTSQSRRRDIREFLRDL